jgi:crossover junction endodeoxyribonuclease RuvC
MWRILGIERCFFRVQEGYNEYMRILGIDPGIGRVGWGVVNEAAGKIQAVDYGCLETAQKYSLAERIEQIYKGTQTLIEVHKPDALAIEDLFFNTNAKTALSVGQARGVVLLAAAQQSMPIAVYTPLQVKVAVSGYGKADKAQVSQMVKALLHLQTTPKPDDVADALAIAITHAFSYKYGKAKTQK